MVMERQYRVNDSHRQWRVNHGNCHRRGNAEREQHVCAGVNANASDGPSGHLGVW